jgi:hypothetical protein
MIFSMLCEQKVLNADNYYRKQKLKPQPSLDKTNCSFIVMSRLLDWNLQLIRNQANLLN